MMKRLPVASQLPPEYNHYFAEAAPNVDLIPIPMGPPIPPPGVEVLIGAPISLVKGDLDNPPEGWPFDLRWTQLVTVGLDFYPRWFQEGTPMASGRGNSGV